MKKMMIMLLCMLTIQFVQAQKIYIPGTGDVEMDNVLTKINDNAKSNLDFFANDVAQKFKIAKSVIDKLIPSMHPGDIFMTAQLASLLNKPFDDILNSFNKNKGKGWGVIAKEMGIKPGSPEFHQMKKMMKSNGNSKEKGNGNSGNKGKGNGNAGGKGKKK